MDKHFEKDGAAHVVKNGTLHRYYKNGKNIVALPVSADDHYGAKFEPATMAQVKAAFVSGQPSADKGGMDEKTAGKVFDECAEYEPKKPAPAAAAKKE